MPTFILKEGMGKHYARIDGQKVCLRPGDRIVCDTATLGSALSKFREVADLPQATKPEARLGKKAKPTTPAAKPTEPAAPEFVVRERGGELDGYDVISTATGEAINDAPLTQREALDLIGEPAVGTDGHP